MNEVRNLFQLMEALKQGYTVSNGQIIPLLRPIAAQKQEETERQFCISIADHSFEINTLYPDTYYLCRNYLTNHKPEIKICISEKTIELERKELEREKIPQSDGYLETLAVYREICEALLSYDTILMHGAIVATEDAAYMFTAESGTGKTTHVKKWLENAEHSYVVNGDKPLIRIHDNEVIACGSPWCGKEQMNTNTMVPLKAIVIMERGENNHIREISLGQAFPFLLQQTYRPNDAEKIKKTLALVAKLKDKVRFYYFVFNNMKSDVFDVAYRAIVHDHL